MGLYASCFSFLSNSRWCYCTTLALIGCLWCDTCIPFWGQWNVTRSQLKDWATSNPTDFTLHWSKTLVSRVTRVFFLFFHNCWYYSSTELDPMHRDAWGQPQLVLRTSRGFCLPGKFTHFTYSWVLLPYILYMAWGSRKARCLSLGFKALSHTRAMVPRHNSNFMLTAMIYFYGVLQQ